MTGNGTEFHEAANIFPLDEEHLDELAEDIRKQGLQVPIETLGGKILDGRRRYLACKRAGVQVRLRAVQVDDPVAYVLSLNLHRRHLSPTQLAMVGARARELYDRQAKERQKARKGHQPGATVENLPQLDSGKARDQVGKVVGVSGKSIDHATRVLKQGAPELVAAVDADHIAVSTAARVCSLSEVEQKAIADRAASSAANGERRRKRPSVAAEGVNDADAERDAGRRGKGIEYAHEALNWLIRIPKNDPFRKRGFQIVTDWIRHNR